MQHDCTVKSTPVVSLCLSYMVTPLLLLTNIILCVIMCIVSSPTPPSFKISQSGAGCVDTVGCHTVSSVGVSVASVAVTSQKTQGNVSLLTSSVCLAGCLIAGVCSGEEKRSAGSVGAHTADKFNPPLPGREGIWPPNKHASLFLAFWHIHKHTTIPKTLTLQTSMTSFPNIQVVQAS